MFVVQYSNKMEYLSNTLKNRQFCEIPENNPKFKIFVYNIPISNFRWKHFDLEIVLVGLHFNCEVGTFHRVKAFPEYSYKNIKHRLHVCLHNIPSRWITLKMSIFHGGNDRWDAGWDLSVSCSHQAESDRETGDCPSTAANCSLPRVLCNQ